MSILSQRVVLWKETSLNKKFLFLQKLQLIIKIEVVLHYLILFLSLNKFCELRILNPNKPHGSLTKNRLIDVKL